MRGVLRVHGVIVVSVGGGGAIAVVDEIMAERSFVLAVRVGGFYGEEARGGGSWGRSWNRNYWGDSRSYFNDGVGDNPVRIWNRVYLNGEVES